MAALQANEWQRCKPWIAAALDNSAHYESLADIERKIEAKEYQFWPGRESAAVTCISVYATRKVLTVMHGGGNLVELLNELEPKMCAFARLEGCDAIAGEGRLGWKRVCENYGYRFSHITMIKDLP